MKRAVDKWWSLIFQVLKFRLMAVVSEDSRVKFPEPVYATACVSVWRLRACNSSNRGFAQVPGTHGAQTDIPAGTTPMHTSF